MTQAFFVPHVLPNLNDIIDAAKRGRKGYQPYAIMKLEQEQIIRASIRKAKLKAMVHPVTLHFYWREKNRKRDLDNVACGRKFVLDALVRSGILSNDGWAQVRGFSDDFVVNAKAPGVHVTITDGGIKAMPLEAV